MITTVAEANPLRYRTTCTDVTCRVVLEFDATDIKHGTRYAMGRECGSYEGIVCPHCRQILTKDKFEVMG